MTTPTQTNSGESWPEQDAVEEWLKENNMRWPHAKTYPLKVAVTKYRLEIQEKLTAAEARVKELEGKRSRFENDCREKLTKCTQDNLDLRREVGKLKEHIEAISWLNRTVHKCANTEELTVFDEMLYLFKDNEKLKVSLDAYIKEHGPMGVGSGIRE
jgi:hypothetical protein